MLRPGAGYLIFLCFFSSEMELSLELKEVMNIKCLWQYLPNDKNSVKRARKGGMRGKEQDQVLWGYTSSKIRPADQDHPDPTR